MDTAPISTLDTKRTNLVKEWVLRIVGYGLAALSSWIGSKWGGEVGAAVGVIGAAATNKAIPYILPTQAKVEAQNQAPPPARFVPKMLQR